MPERAPSEPTDERLIAAATAGDVGAFERLVGRHKRGLVAFVEGLVVDPGIAREVAHDAFCAAYYALDGLRDAGQFTSWLFTIARNFAMSHHRERRRRREDSLDGEAGREVQAARSADPGPAEATQRSEVARKLLDGIGRLPAPLREVVTARYFDDLTCQEIASRTGTTVGTVTKQLTRARRLLRDRLDPAIRPGGAQ